MPARTLTAAVSKHPFHPYHPIIYVRGFAATMGEIEETVADPFMGFNIGSTKARRLNDGTLQQFYFESPLVRFFSDHDYDDVYDSGMDQVLDPRAERTDLPYKCLLIHRYYDSSSESFGDSNIKPIEEFAKNLSELIDRLRAKVCAKKEDGSFVNGVAPKDFRVYLVAHSMGGLICRAFLQNPELDPKKTAGCVDKFFTYATPHNGIDLRIVGNVPGWSVFGEAKNFNREKIAGYLGLPAGTEEVSELKNFEAERVFNLVGTNPSDYLVLSGISRWAAGDASDGLVKIPNATTHENRPTGSAATRIESPRAFVYRSHSGHYGIVNSEEGYQNLIRFLFGDVRVDGILDIEELTLPPKVEQALQEGKEIKAAYQFEVGVAIRGHQWQMHRRNVRENSAIFRTFKELFPTKGGVSSPNPARSPHLFSVFLDMKQRVNKRRRSFAFAFDLSVMVPDYTINQILWKDDHYEGGRMFSDRIVIEATPPSEGMDSENISNWKIRYGLQSATPNSAPNPIEDLSALQDTGHQFFITLPQYASPPSMRARLRIETRPWNLEPRQ
jgi:hypothetical protein